VKKADRKQNGTPWTCGRGHVLGLTVTSRENGRWVTRLMKFRHAISETQLVVEVDAVVEGTVREIVCDACPPEERLTRTWWGKPGQG